MGKGKRKRERAEARERRSAGLALVQVVDGEDAPERLHLARADEVAGPDLQIDVDEYAAAHEAGMSYEEKADKGIIGPVASKQAPLYGGYHWRGDMLCNGRGEPLGQWTKRGLEAL